MRVEGCLTTTLFLFSLKLSLLVFNQPCAKHCRLSPVGEVTRLPLLIKIQALSSPLISFS